MSWDIFIQRLPKKITSINDIPDDFEPPALGAKAKVMKSIRTVFRDLPFGEDGYVSLEVQGGSIEIDIGPDDPVYCVMLAVRGEEAVVGPVAAVVDSLGGQAIDVSSPTGLFDADTAARSLAANQEKAKKVTKKKATSKAKAKAKSTAKGKAAGTKKGAAKPAAKKSTRSASKGGTKAPAGRAAKKKGR